jgi:hypothetical protein
MASAETCSAGAQSELIFRQAQRGANAREPSRDGRDCPIVGPYRRQREIDAEADLRLIHRTF